MVAVINAAVGMPPLNFRAAMRLGMFFNCTTGQCNPGYTKLAKEIGCTLDSAKRACRELEADGWLKRKRTEGGHHEDKTAFDLLMPTTRVSRTDTPAAGQTAQGRVSKYAATGVQNGQGRVSITDSLMNTENTERAYGPRSEYVDRVVDVTPVTDDARARAYSALVRAYPKYPPDCSDDECREIFDQHLDAGIDADDIIDGAANYADQCKGTKPRLLIYYLRVKGWQWENYHLLHAVN
jgi:DNA-binding transcriptional regulator YhcF (GntR family)